MLQRLFLLPLLLLLFVSVTVGVSGGFVAAVTVTVTGVCRALTCAARVLRFSGIKTDTE